MSGNGGSRVSTRSKASGTVLRCARYNCTGLTSPARRENRRNRSGFVSARRQEGQTNYRSALLLFQKNRRTDTFSRTVCARPNAGRLPRAPPRRIETLAGAVRVAFLMRRWNYGRLAPSRGGRFSRFSRPKSISKISLQLNNLVSPRQLNARGIGVRFIYVHMYLINRIQYLFII